MRKSQRMNFPANAFSSFAYDAIWSIALTLQKSSAVLKAHNKSLSNITYSDRETTEVFKQVLRNLTFIGMSVSGYTANLQRNGMLWMVLAEFTVAQNSSQYLEFDGLLYNHSLLLDATIMVSKNCSIIGEHVVIIFVTP